MKSCRRDAFTLIELLVVISIIVVLIGVAFPVFQGVQNAAKKTQAKNDLLQIVTAVNAYYTEYGKYPVTITDATKDAYFGTVTETAPTGAVSYANNDVLIDVLRSNTGSAQNTALVTTLNPRGIAFLDPRSVGNNASPTGGVIPNGATVVSPKRVGVWYDPWGSPYKILIDTTYDNSLANPYLDAPGGSTLAAGIVCWSLGASGTLGGGTGATGFSKEAGSANNYTNSGDIISWR
ncbi:MAG: prepilin-type N-terminal cleavage/methylation domain-containing protein [Verrucomicrobiota bacterium]|nr:prepilin-type N-terminal cleavage/methylation domain-containing protein [Verrucomicrobiota bacterium]